MKQNENTVAGHFRTLAATTLAAVLACGALNSWLVTSASADGGGGPSLQPCPEGCSGHLCGGPAGGCYCKTETDGTKVCLLNGQFIPVEP